jgi:hypothetical protein
MSDPIEKNLDKILELQEKDVAVIPESLFVSHLLPFLVAEDDRDASLTMWLEVAGDWRRPIDVTDVKSGEVLFRVPALVANTGQPTLQRAENSAYELIENAQRKMRVVPRAGEEMLVKGLSERVKGEGSREENLAAWNAIYRRYGYEHLISSEAREAEAAAPTESKSNVVGYDEL